MSNGLLVDRLAPVLGTRVAFFSISLTPGKRMASLYSPYYQQISVQVGVWLQLFSGGEEHYF